MYNRIAIVSIIWSSATFLSACSMVRTDPTQTLIMETNPAGADCSLTRESEEIGRVNPTPGEVVVDRSRYDISVLCKKEGYQDGTDSLESGVRGTLFWNILAADVVRLGIDAASGANNSYRETTTITLLPVMATNQQISEAPKQE